MKNATKWLLIIAAFLLALPANAQFGGLKNLAKGAKQKVTQPTNTRPQNRSTVEEYRPKVDFGTRATETETNAAATTQEQRTQAPWPMSGGKYNGMSPREFVYGIKDVSDEEIVALRDQNFARYKSNLPLIQNWGNGSDIAQEENQNFLRLLYEIRTVVSANVCNVQVSSNGAINGSNAHYLITNRLGGGIGAFAMEKDGRFQFVMKDDTGTYLNGEELATARDAAVRMRKLQQFTYGLNNMLKADANNYDVNLGVMYNLCGMYANAVEKACEGNTPENIERKPRPAGGALHASIKAKALAVAKADDPEVVDVIITSGKWDVKTNAFGIPVNRNIYGYYIYKDEVGLQCCPRMWSEDYQGGKYGSLRKGGVGVGSPFYIK